MTWLPTNHTSTGISPSRSPLLQPSLVLKCFEIYGNKSTGEQFNCLMTAPSCICISEKIVVWKFICVPLLNVIAVTSSSQNLFGLRDAPRTKWPVGPFCLLVKWPQFTIPLICNIRIPQIMWHIIWKYGATWNLWHNTYVQRKQTT